MGIRDIEERDAMRNLFKKKAAELRMKQLETQTAITKMTKEKLGEIARKHGVIIALDPDMQAEVEEIRKKYNIPKERVIREQITEDDVMKKGTRVDHMKLGMLTYQRVMLEKEDTGGLYTLPEVLELMNTGILKNRITIDDAEKAMRLLKKENVIPDLKQLPSGILTISFFPVQFTQDQAAILELVKGDGLVTTGEVCRALSWPPERAERALQNLVDTRVARITETFREGKKYFFPSLQLAK